MADFNINILSTLAIDPNTSTKSINDSIKTVQKNVNNIQVGLEAKQTKDASDALRVSANSVIKKVNTGETRGNLQKIEVGFEVNEKKAVASINAALNRINTNYHRKLVVDVEARVNTKAIASGVKAATPRTTLPQGFTETGIDDGSLARTGSAAKEVAKDIFDLGRAFESTKAIQQEAMKAMQKGFTYTARENKNAEDQLTSYIVTLNKANEAGKTLAAHTYRYQPNEDGGLSIKSYSDVTKELRVQEETHQRILGKIDQEREKIKDRNNMGKISTNQAKELNAIYDKLIEKNTRLTNAQFNSSNSAAKEALRDYEFQNKALKKKEDLLNQINRIERRNADSVDKTKTADLKRQLNSLGSQPTGFGKNDLFTMNQLHTKVRAVAAEAERATRSQMGFVDAFRQALVKFPVWMGATTLFFGAIQSGKTFIQVIRDIDSQMVTLAKVLPDSADLAGLFNKANEAALNYGQTLNGVLDAYAEFARQGYNENEIALFGNAALVAANVGEIEAKQASEYLTSMGAQWETSATDAMRQVDALNEISNNYATTVEKLAQGQAKAGSTAKAMGLSFDETNAIIGMLTAKTKQSGDEIGNFMKAVLPKLYMGTGKSTLEDLGINLNDSNGELKNAIQLLQEAAEKTQHLDKAQQAAVVKGLGGVYHYQRMQVLLDDLAKTDSMYKSIKETSEASAGSALAENAKYMESIEAKVNKAKVSIEQFALALGELFVESGILEGLRTFTDFMTGLTKAVSDGGIKIPAAITAIAGSMALLSKNVRSGFDGARMSIAEFILKANDLERVMNKQDKITHIAPIGQVADAKDASKQMYQASRNAADSSASGIYALKKANDQLSISSLYASGAINKQTLAATANAAKTRLAAGAANLLKGAFVGLASATVIGAGFAALSMIIGKIVNDLNKGKEAVEAFEQQQATLKQTVQSMPTDELDAMVAKYGELQSKMASGKAFSSDEVTQYKTTVSQLANIFPDLVSHEGKYGQVINGNQAILQSRIDTMREQLEIEKEIARQRQLDDNKAAIKQKDKEADSLRNNKVFSFNNNAQAALTQAVGTSFKGVSADVEAQIRAVKDLASAQTALKAVNESLSEAVRNGDETAIKGNQRKQAQLTEYITLMSSATAAEQASIGIAVQNFNSMASQMSASIEGMQYKIGVNGSAMLQILAQSIGSVAKNGTDAEDKLNKLYAVLSTDTGFVQKMSSYEAAIERFKNASPADQPAIIKELQTLYTSLATSILEAAKAAGIKGAALNTLRQTLSNNISAETGLAAKISKTGEVELKTMSATEKRTRASKVKKEAIEAEAQAEQELADANKATADSMRDLQAKHDLVGRALQEMNEGSITWATMADLVEQYGDKVLGLAGDEAALMDFLMSKRDEETANFNKNMQNKLDTSTAYYQAVAGQGTELAKHLKDTYGIDAENYNTIAQLKGGIADTYSKGTQKQQEQLVDAIAESYGIDLSNYGSLGAKKEALETHVLNILSKKWADHVTELRRMADEAFAEFDAAYAVYEQKLSKYNKDTKNGKIGLNPSFPAAEGLSAALTVNQAGMKLLGAGVEANPVTNSGLVAKMVENMLGADTAFKKATGSGKDLSSVVDGLNKSLDGSGDSGGKAAKGIGKAAKEAEKAKKEAEKAGVEVEKLYKSFTVTTYVADKLALALAKVNQQLEKQKLNTQKYATWSQQYRNSLREENKLIEQKTKNIDKQIASLERQIKAGVITEYGLVNSETNVPYYQYSANGLSGSQTGSVSVKGNSTQAQVWNFLKSKGFSDAQAAGIMGNIEQESGFKANAQQMSGAYNGGKGLFQWDGVRRNNLYNYAASKGKSWTDLQTQLEFFWKELTTTEIAAYNYVKGATTAVQAAQVFQQKFERAGIPNQANRNAAAQKYMNMYSGKGTTAGTFSSSGAVSGTSGALIVADSWVRDKQFGRYNAADGGGVHYGRDLNAANIHGKAIRAAKSGVVTYSGWTGGGNTISIFDGQNTYTYMHMNKPSPLKKGQTVQAGQVVGQVGNTFDSRLGGWSSGSHLHVQVNKGRTASGTAVSTFTGANAAIDPVKYGYINVSGASSGKPITSGTLSGFDVTGLNEAEQRRLAEIEATIAAFNAGEAMKQKVDDARVKLLDLQLERARLLNESDETTYNILKSSVEAYTKKSQDQAAITSKLQYELDKVAFEKGTNSKEWISKNKQLQASKALEEGFEQDKIAFINKITANSKYKKLLGKGTVFRDELDGFKKEAQETIRDIRAGVRQLEGEAAAAYVGMVMDDFEKAQTKYEQTMKDIEKKKAFLDIQDNKQSATNVAYTKAQASQEEAWAAQIKYTITQLQIQQAAIKGNHDLYKQVTDQIADLEKQYLDAQIAARNFNNEAANLDIDRTLRINEHRAKGHSKRLEKAQYAGAFIDQEYQIDLYRANQVEQLKGLAYQRKGLLENLKQLEKLNEKYKDMPTHAKKLKDEMENVNKSLQETNKQVHEVRHQLANSVIQSIKTIYQKQLEVATKAYDDEYKAYEKMINKKLKLIDDEADEDSYRQEVEDRTEAMNKLRNEIAQRTGDDSLANQSKLKDLREQLKQQEKEYDNYLKNRDRQKRKEALQEELSDKGEQIEKQKEDMNKAYEDLLNDTRRFNEIQEQLMEGQIDRYKELITDLTTFVNDNMQEIGRSASQNILDALNEAFYGMDGITNYLEMDERKHNPVPNSNLKPTPITEVSDAAIKAVNNIVPNVTNSPSMANATLPNTPLNTTQTITNNNTMADALVNIQNFNGTKQEADNLATTLADSLRVQGIKF